MAGYEWRRQVIYCQAEAGWWEERVAAHFDDAAAAVGLVERLGLAPENAGAGARAVHRRTPAPGLARALVKRPRALLLGRTHGGPGSDATARVETEVRRYLDEGGAALLVTHSEEQARRLCRRAWRMRQGKLETLWT